MGLFDKLFKKKTEDVTPIQPAKVEKGTVEINSLKFTDETVKRIQENGFIAFDVETTGLSSTNDRIIELGAVKFMNGEEVASFGTLVNPKVPVPAAATNVNHITNAMLSSAPCEESVYPDFLEFIGDALDGKTVICAHNASFDLHFLAETLMRLGYSGTIEYLDTLTASRRTIKDLGSYSQPVLCEYFGIINDRAHRAEDDARACGKILYALIPLKPADKEKRAYSVSPADYEKNKPNDSEKYVCAFVQKMLSDAGENIEYISFYRNSSSYVDIRCLYDVFKFKIAKKGAYIIVETELLNKVSHSLKTEPCTVSEGIVNTRVFFENPYELNQLKDIIVSNYDRALQSASQYYNDHPDYEAETAAEYGYIPYRIDADEVEQLVAEINPEDKMFEDSAAVKEREKEEKARLAEEKRLAKEQERLRKQAEKEAAAGDGGSRKRAIIQMNDDLEVIKEFESISDAVKETGINSKSIRDAAKGVQKHAGGFVWKYKDEIE